MISAGTRLTPSTVYRFLHNHQLMKVAPGCQDRRKFEAELPNDIWQSDVMHGPLVTAAPRQKKSYLIAFIDDHSRLVPYAQFYLSENLNAFLDAFEKALLKRGLPRKLYTDNGSAFRSKHLEHTTASLGIALVHARPYLPQGKGKIERFFRRVRQQFLPGVASPVSLDDLNQQFERWLREDYHNKLHTAIGTTPAQRFTAKMECIRPAPDNLSDHFRCIAGPRPHGHPKRPPIRSAGAADRPARGSALPPKSFRKSRGARRYQKLRLPAAGGPCRQLPGQAR